MELPGGSLRDGIAPQSKGPKYPNLQISRIWGGIEYVVVSEYLVGVIMMADVRVWSSTLVYRMH